MALWIKLKGMKVKIMNIKVYWRKHCQLCKDVFNYLDRKAVLYEKIDVTYDQSLFNEMHRLGGFATPFIVIDGKTISYFEPQKMDQILEVS
jgi:glutaredoxin